MEKEAGRQALACVQYRSRAMGNLGEKEREKRARHTLRVHWGAKVEERNGKAEKGTT